MEYKNYKIPDADIDTLVDNLQVSIFDACELWLSDHGEVTNDEQDALTECSTTGCSGSCRSYSG